LLGLEANAGQAERLDEALTDVVHVRHATDTLDHDPEQREGEVRVVEARAGRKHHLSAVERLEQLVRRREAERQPRFVVRLPLQAGSM
jgi:hypothetical protein